MRGSAGIRSHRWRDAGRVCGKSRWICSRCGLEVEFDGPVRQSNRRWRALGEERWTDAGTLLPRCQGLEISQAGASAGRGVVNAVAVRRLEGAC